MQCESIPIKHLFELSAPLQPSTFHLYGKKYILISNWHLNLIIHLICKSVSTH